MLWSTRSTTTGEDVVRRTRGALPADAEAARERLMDAAEACVEQYGIAKTTMDDIAKMAGVSRPTVYRHFSDRDNLILAVVMRRSRMLAGRAVKAIGRYDTFPDQLVEGLLFMVEKGRKDPFVRLLVAPEHMNLANRILGGNLPAELTYEIWEPILVEARERGELRPDLDFGAVSRWLTYLIVLLLGRFEVDDDVDAQREMLRTFVVPAFVPDAPAAPARSGRRRSARAG
jgi:AcrR family transcriptional regulator